MVLMRMGLSLASQVDAKTIVGICDGRLLPQNLSLGYLHDPSLASQGTFDYPKPGTACYVLPRSRSHSAALRREARAVTRNGFSTNQLLAVEREAVVAFTLISAARLRARCSGLGPLLEGQNSRYSRWLLSGGVFGQAAARADLACLGVLRARRGMRIDTADTPLPAW